MLPSQNRDAHLFHVEKKHRFSRFLMLLIIVWFWAQGFRGSWDPSFFDIFRKTILWSGTYVEVFIWCLGVQGTP